MAQLCPFNWFQYGGRRHLGFCGMSMLPVKPVVGPHFMSLCQIRCESVQNWIRFSLFLTAVKCDDDPVVLAVLDQLGCGFDCGSKVSNHYAFEFASFDCVECIFNLLRCVALASQVRVYKRLRWRDSLQWLVCSTFDREIQVRVSLAAGGRVATVGQ